jgi:hypothetical protein
MTTSERDTDITLDEHLDQSARWADDAADVLARDLAREGEWHDPVLDGDTVKLPLRAPRVEKLVKGLHTVAALLRDVIELRKKSPQ